MHARALCRTVLPAALLCSALLGCLPAVVIVDRPSVIEEESAGEWMDIEEELSLLHGRLESTIQVRGRSRVSRGGVSGAEEADLPATRLLPTGELPAQGATAP